MARPKKSRLCLFSTVFLILHVLNNADSHGMPRGKGGKKLGKIGRLKRLITPGRLSIANMTCDFIAQPLNHFMLPRDGSLTYLQRYCTYNGFVEPAYRSELKSSGSDAAVPLFLYTGNESPLPEYINNTGLMFELAETMGAQVIFIEHRYEGESLPSPAIPNCLAYSSSVQALADMAAFLAQDDYRDRPVIAFGGSYGGMLSAWLRFLYPHLVAGAIAGSAPIFGFPRIAPRNIDTAWQVIRHGLQQSYPPTNPIEDSGSNSCASNVLAAWPLIRALGESEEGRHVLSKAFRLCSILPANATDQLLDFAQSPWFDMAEGSFPYPSGYIVFALTKNDQAELPAWPVQAACWNHSRLHEDLGVRLEGSIANVSYTVRYGDELQLRVDWDKVEVLSRASSPMVHLNESPSSTVWSLLTALRDAVSVWFNVTKDVPCYNLTAAPNAQGSAQDLILGPDRGVSEASRRRLAPASSPSDDDPATQCRDRVATTGSWPSLCCNEGMDLIIAEARGLGRDCFWPPTHPRGTASHADVIAADGAGGSNATDPFCDDPRGHFGFPKGPPDPWATWMDTIYGGARIEDRSNVVFSNGLLDPWSAAGVYARGTMDESFEVFRSRLRASSFSPVPGLYVQNITRGMIALVMEFGGHHTDLMYSSSRDPPSITEARRIEKDMIRQWIEEWKSKRACQLAA